MFTVFGFAFLNLLMVWGLAKDLFLRQAIFWLFGIFVFFAGKAFGTKKFFGFNRIFYGAITILLFFLLFFGRVSRGSSRWLDIRGFSLGQPSEFAKPFLIGFASREFFLGAANLGKFLLNFVSIIVPTILIVLQPDLGSGVIIFAVLAFLLMFAQKRVFWWLGIFAFFAVSLLLFGGKFIKPYQVMRIKSFLNPYSDPLNSGYNSIQAKIAIGSGGWFGRGFGQGRQTQLAYLPEKHTDFIFASIAEELGFFGASFCLFLYFWFFLTLLKMIKKTREKIDERGSFDFYLKLGIFTQFFLQTALNLAMCLGLFPIVGVPLPFVSYGGSSLLTSLFSLGLFFSQ